MCGLSMGFCLWCGSMVLFMVENGVVWFVYEVVLGGEMLYVELVGVGDDVIVFCYGLGGMYVVWSSLMFLLV